MRQRRQGHTRRHLAQRARGLAAALGMLALLALAACGSQPTATSALRPATAGTATRTASATSTPGASATPGPQPAAIATDLANARLRATADAYLSHMSLDQKLGQMMLIETGYTTYTWEVNDMVVNQHAGATILYAPQNITDPQQVHDYVAALQQHADLPLLVSIDEEGGVVDRLGQFFGPTPAAQDMAASGNPQVAQQWGATVAHNLLSLGINTNLAPVVDVRSISDAVEFTRLFGDDPSTVQTYAGAFMQGLQQNGVVACLKHWPGIGSTSADPHLKLPTITRSLAQLESTDFAPFRGLLAQDPGMIMVTHVVVPAIDPTLPATFSPKLVDGVLRGELGFDGVVMTDSLYMKAISDQYDLGQAAVLSVIAGDDLLEGAYSSYTMTLMINALKTAISQGRISEARIDQSVRRILMLKARFGLLPLVSAQQQAARNAGGPALAGVVAPFAAADVPHHGVDQQL